MKIIANHIAAAGLLTTLSSPLFAHTTADDELAHAEMPELQYLLCESVERSIAYAEARIDEAKQHIKGTNDSERDLVLAWNDLDFYGQTLPEYYQELGELREMLTEHGFSHGICGLEV